MPPAKHLPTLLFYCCIGLIPMGWFFQLNDWSGGPSLLALGLLGLFIYFAARLVKKLKENDLDKATIFFLALLVLMSVTLFAKYLNHPFWNIPSLIIIPVFILGSLLFLIKIKNKDKKIIIATGFYLLLIIPLFFRHIHRAPARYSMQGSYGRYDPGRYVSVTLPYKFKYSKTERLCNRALKLKRLWEIDHAIEILNQARSLEPDNPEILFHLSNFYARDDSLERAITLLDTAISIDHSWGGLFNNRGLLYYKLSENKKAEEDYKQAIILDSTNPVFYVNISLVYYYENDFEKACEALTKSEQLGEDLSDEDFLITIKNKYCK